MYKKIAPYFLLLIVCFIVTSAAFSGYFLKRAFYDTDKLYGDLSVISMLEGSTQKPYVYRQLVPYLANSVENFFSESSKRKIKQWITKDRGGVNNNVIYNKYAQAVDSKNPNIIIKYYIVYIIAYVALFLSVFILRQVCIDQGADVASATLAPLIFILALPYLQTEGSFFYDLTELLFMALAVLMAQRRYYAYLIITVVIATLNKESFLAFSLALMPFLIQNLGFKKAFFYQIVLVCIATTVNFLIKTHYVNNLGSAVEWHFFHQLQAIFSLSSYFSYDFVYGMIAPKGYNLFSIILLVIIVKQSYRFLSPVIKRHTLAALAINLPLFLLFCYPGELRNLSFLFVSLNVMLSINIQHYLQKYLVKNAN